MKSHTSQKNWFDRALVPGLCFIAFFLWIAAGWAKNEGSKRKTVINFDDELVEGINRKPLDSVNQISESEARRRMHLYRKRAGFTDLNEELAKDLRLK